MMIRIWPISEVSVHSIEGYGECVCFADWLLSSCEYLCLDDERIILWSGPPKPLARNIDEFIAKCVSNDRSIYG